MTLALFLQLCFQLLDCVAQSLLCCCSCCIFPVPPCALVHFRHLFLMTGFDFLFLPPSLSSNCCEPLAVSSSSLQVSFVQKVRSSAIKSAFSFIEVSRVFLCRHLIVLSFQVAHLSLMQPLAAASPPAPHFSPTKSCLARWFSTSRIAVCLRLKQSAEAGRICGAGLTRVSL